MTGADDIDGTTGLPRTPEGYFWRVGDDCGMYVEFRKRGRFWSRPYGGREYLAYHLPAGTISLGLASPEVVKDAILKAAQSIVRDFERDDLRMDHYKRFSGDYPPKNLNN